MMTAQSEISTQVATQCPRVVKVHRHSASSIYGYALKGNARSPASTPSSSTPASSPQITRPSSLIHTPGTSTPTLPRSTTFDRLSRVTRIIAQLPETPEYSQREDNDDPDEATIVSSPDTISCHEGSHTTSISLPRPVKSEPITPRYRSIDKPPAPVTIVTIGPVATVDLETGFQNRLNKIRQSTFTRILIDIAKSSKTNVLLVLVPVGIALFYADVEPAAAFTVNILGMIPLAGVFCLWS